MSARNDAIDELIKLSNLVSGKDCSKLKASILFTIYNDCLNFSNKRKDWLMSDIFIYCSNNDIELFYANSLLFGFNYSLQDLQNYGSIHSKCKKLLEYNSSNANMQGGIYGQNIANAVGIALAMKEYNSSILKDDTILNNYVYAFIDIEDLISGINIEACVSARYYQLNNLIILVNCDSKRNNNTAIWINYVNLFEGFFIQEIDAYDNMEIIRAVSQAKQQMGKASIIFCCSKTECENEKNKFTHLICDYKSLINWKFSKKTLLLIKEGEKKKKNYFNENIKDVKFYNNTQINDVNQIVENLVEKNWFYDVSTFESTKMVLNTIKNKFMFFELYTLLENKIFSNKEENDAFYKSKNFGLSSIGEIANGIALYGVYDIILSAKLIDVDYIKASLRLASIMNLHILYLFSSDSILNGEGSKLNQPFEQLNMLRSIPNFNVYRPCDAREAVAGIISYLQLSNKPTALILSSQPLKMLNSDIEKAKYGAYVLEESPLKNYDVTLVSSGSEVYTCVQLRNLLFQKGYNARVVSMPSVTLFDAQATKYKNRVLGNKLRIFIELSNDSVYQKYSRDLDKIFNLQDFCPSGKTDEVLNEIEMSECKLFIKIEKCIKTYLKLNKTLLN